MAVRVRTCVCFAAMGMVGMVAGLWVGRCWPGSAPSSVYRMATGGEAARGAAPSSFAPVVEQAALGIVGITAHLHMGHREPDVGDATRQPVARPQADVRYGSGFVVHAQGLVVTSRHVVLSATQIDVTLTLHGTLRAELVGEDQATDLALLRLVSPPPGLLALPIGDSHDLRAGDWIIAVGNPYGFAQTVTAGVVSFVGRHLPHSDLGVTNDFLQFSAPVNPGSSGGPVLDLAGRVVGVTTQAASEAQGISFAVPSASLVWALDAMERRPDGRVRRGYLGITFASLAGTDDSGQPNQGAVITGVMANEPAARAGLRRGDVVLRVDGERIVDAQGLHEQIVRREPGARIVLALLRNGEIQDPIEAVLGEVGSPRPLGRAQ
ncbi:MAG: trypsin-like peptidase domain-containing protein [Planctomycetes bacterium]|nr:trypsin-like peptidase domain-containing protein [Planctomycetota bacterium]